MSDLFHSSLAKAHLESLQEHPSAPKFNFASSDLLTRERLDDVRRFEREILNQRFWGPGHDPIWMKDFLGAVFSQVPFYKEFGDAPKELSDIPTVGRNDFAREVERFIPDDFRVEDLTVYTTSGTAGSTLTVPSESTVTSKVLTLIDRILSRLGQSLPRGPGQVALAALFYQKETLTYPSLSHFLHGASTLKLNLHPSDWRADSDRGDYLRDTAPAVVSGCPRSLKELSRVAPELRPIGIFSSAVTLDEHSRNELMATFQCPVYDIYSMTESKYIACRTEDDGFELLSPDLFVEIVDKLGLRLPDGTVGEIALTGGRNRCLPLVRYRTGDRAALHYRGHQPVLVNFQGRIPVDFVSSQGEYISSQDVIWALREFPFEGFHFHQKSNGSYLFRYTGYADQGAIKSQILALTGLRGETIKQGEWQGKPHQFSRE